MADRLVLIDGVEGFLLRDYARALDFLGTEDPDLVAEHDTRIRQRVAREIPQG